MSLLVKLSRVVAFVLPLCGWCSVESSLLDADEFYVAERDRFPGRLLVASPGTPPRVVVERQARPDRAYPNAVMKLQQVAVGVDNGLFYCSGLDGSLMHLLDGRHEIQSFEFPGQIRDIATTDEEHTVYFSVVPTPQNGAPLADGKIYRRDFWEGAATEVATIRQADVGGQWWGTFAIRGNVIYLATYEQQSQLFELTSDGPRRVFVDNTLCIHGLCSAGDDGFVLTAGDGKIYRTADFVTFDVVLQTEQALSDVAVRPRGRALRP